MKKHITILTGLLVSTFFVNTRNVSVFVSDGEFEFSFVSPSAFDNWPGTLANPMRRTET